MDSFATLMLFVFMLSAVIAGSTFFTAYGEDEQAMNAEILSKHYSSGYFPVIGSYVEYEVRLTTVDGIKVENNSLWVLFESDGKRTHSYATYSLAPLEPGGGKVFHVGPFKMQEEGAHHLFMGIDGVTLGYRPDSFTVYRQDAIQPVLIAIPLIGVGAGIAGFSLHRNKKRKTV